LIPFAELTRINDSSLNVLLFVPLGIAIGLLAWSPRAAAILVAGLLLPFVIEATQAWLPALGRGCQSADVVDNITGLVVGLVIGRLAGRSLATG
jgi:VanZ family protein